MTQYVELKIVVYVDSVNTINIQHVCTYDDYLFIFSERHQISSHKNIAIVERIIKLSTHMLW